MVENEVAPGDLEARKENKRSPPKTKFSDLARKQGKNIANQKPQDDGKTRHKECLPKKRGQRDGDGSENFSRPAQ